MRVVLLLMLGLFTLTGCASQATFGDAITQGEPTAIPTPVVPSKPVYQVERGKIVYERRFFGRITPSVTEEVAFAIDGRVLEILVDAGADVSQGDVLARLNIAGWENQLLDAEEELAIAASILESAEGKVRYDSQRAALSLEMAQLKLDHAIAQASEEASSDDRLEINLLTLERDLALVAVDELASGVDPQLRFDVARAQKRVDEIKATIAKAELVAPMSGRLVNFSPDPGEPVLAYDPIGLVADLSVLEITDDMSPEDLSELNEGMPLLIKRAALPGNVYSGIIASLPAPYGLATDELVHVSFDEQPPLGEFDVGDRMNYTVVIEERDDVLWLPQSAIRQFSGRNFIVVRNEGVQQRVDVRLGLEGDGRVEILEGADEGQTVIGP
ncbi:MAG: efflux RND transporter periplasmic adaptor subunit [Chloroflexota bacterium]|nr:efflux RND transporter periplasmic adaptor subunit [Chloroflexota bacterium]MDE2910576.1 efflux RND transporter periplasmic adaptor subunit [Chloroflexota bacterium]